MGIEKVPFRSYTLDEDRKEKNHEIVSVKLNKEEYSKLQELKKKIEQPKDSTAIKTLMELGAEVILEPKTRLILDTLFKNRRNNQRTGLTEF